MKALVVILFALIVGFGAKTVLRKERSQPDNKPEFKFEKETHDFGKIAQGKAVSVDFKFTNIGGEALTISKVESTSSNTVPQYSTASVKKGESGVITIKFSPGTQPQAFTKAVMIHSNAKTPTKVLYIKGEIVASGSSAL